MMAALRFAAEYMTKLRIALSCPTHLYGVAAQESGVARALTFAVMSMFLYGASLALLLGISSVQLQRVLFSIPIQGATVELLTRIGPPALLLVLMPLYGLVVPFVAAGLLHVSSRLVGGRGDLLASYRILAYATAPTVLAWIPVLGLAAGIYQAAMLIIGVMELHRLPVGRAVLAWLFPSAMTGLPLGLLLNRL